MKNKATIRVFVQKILALIFLCQLFPAHAWASEPVPYLVKHAQLPDSTDYLKNDVLLFLNKTLKQANLVLDDIKKRGFKAVKRVRVTPRGKKHVVYKQFKSVEEAGEYAFALAYYKLSYPEKKYFGGHMLETSSVIHSRKLKSGAEVRHQNTILPLTSEYPGIVNGAVINYCGQNFGADKISHFFSDGFLMYNKLREGKLHSTEDLRQLSDLFERSTMGLEFSGVYSRADIAANVKGAQFFQDLFANKIVKIDDQDHRLVANYRAIDFCQYFDNSLSEAFNPNKYSPLKKSDSEIVEHLSEAGFCAFCKVQIGKNSGSNSLLKNIGLYTSILASAAKHSVLERFNPRFPQRVYSAYLHYADEPRP